MFTLFLFIAWLCVQKSRELGGCVNYESHIGYESDWYSYVLRVTAKSCPAKGSTKEMHSHFLPAPFSAATCVSAPRPFSQKWNAHMDQRSQDMCSLAVHHRLLYQRCVLFACHSPFYVWNIHFQWDYHLAWVIVFPFPPCYTLWSNEERSGLALAFNKMAHFWFFALTAVLAVMIMEGLLKVYGAGTLGFTKFEKDDSTYCSIEQLPPHMQLPPPRA